MTAISSSGRLCIVFHQLSFLLTGICTTLGIQWLFYKGAATGDTFLAQMSQYIGMVMVGLLIPLLLRNKQRQYARLSTSDDEEIDTSQPINLNVMLPDKMTDEASKEQVYVEGSVQHASVIRLALLDVVANSCVTLGFSMIGSGMYQVIYSSVVIWCAILTFFLMGRTLARLQWVAILGTSAGLALSALGQHEENGKTDAPLMVGTLLTLGGTFFYSCVYVYSDYILSRQSPSPLPARVCFYTGIYTSILSLTWIAIYTLPRFDQLIHVDPTMPRLLVVGVYVLVTLANGTHSWNYYELIDRTGSVATGILQGLRAVLVYVISHIWFCHSDTAQCFTLNKACGSLLVIGCVLLFTVAAQRTKA